MPNLRRLKPEWKFRKPVKETVNTKEDNVQTPGSRSGLPPNAMNLSETGVAEHGSLPAEGVAPGLSKSTKLDGKLTADAKPSRDLWEEAHERLSQHKQDLLSKIEKIEGPKVVKQVVQQVEQKYAEHDKGPWKTAFESTLKSILNFKDLINFAVSCDPTGHAATAWTVVSLGLQMRQNALDRRQNVLKACGLLAGNLELMAAFEASYRFERFQDTTHLEDNIVIVYVAILELSAEVVRKNTTGQKILSSFTKLADQPLQEVTKTLKEAQEELRKWADIVKQESHRELMRNVDSMLADLEKTARQVSETFNRILTQEENSILDWLSKYPFDTYKATEEQREYGTGDWILNSSQYKEWKTSVNRLMWLYGNSGCGKSYLCSRIIEDLTSLDESEPRYVLAYWFFTDNNQDSLNTDNLLYCLTRQLCGRTKHIPDSVRELWNRNYAAGTKPTGTLVENTLDSVVIELQKTDHEVLIVLDGLDEFPVKARQGLSGSRTVPGRESVLEWLHRFCEKHENTRVLMASRKENDIQGSLGDATSLDVAKNISEDVDLFIEGCIERIIKGDGKWKSRFKSDMRGKMKRAGERQFRWVYLVEQRFLGCNTPEILQKALKDLPKDVVDLYAQVLKDIPEDDKETARLILIWLTYSVKPLKLDEVASAVGIPSPQKVLDICTSSLIFLQREHGSIRHIVKFDHFSVKEYLTSEKFRTSSETSSFYTSPLIAHLTIAKICVSRFININNFNLATGKSMGAKPAEIFVDEWWPPGKDPLLSYSRLWYKHIQEADTIDRSEAQSAETQQISCVLRGQSHRLFCKEYFQSFQNWHHLLWKYDQDFDGITIRRFRKAASPILMASIARLPNNVRRLLDSGADIDGDVGNVNSNHNPSSQTIITRPIHAAAISGTLEILGLLLEKGATLNQSELDMVARENLRRGADVLRDILRERPSLKITEDTAMASAMNLSSKEALSYIMDNEDHFTQSQLVAIAKNFRAWGQDHDMIEKIMSYGERINCDRNDILIAFLCRSNCDIGSLLDRYQPPHSMANLILQSILGNIWGSEQKLQSVFEYYKDVGVDIHISPGMLEKALKSRHLWLFSTIVKHAKTVIIGTDTLQALRNNFDGMSVMYMLMERVNYHKITGETMQLAAQLDKTALETLQKNTRPNVILPSANECKDIVEKRRSGTLPQTESTLARGPSSEPAAVLQSKNI